MMEPNGQEQGNSSPRDGFIASSGDEGGRDDNVDELYPLLAELDPDDWEDAAEYGI